MADLAALSDHLSRCHAKTEPGAVPVPANLQEHFRW